MNAYLPFVAALLCLVLGLSVGKAWERYKLRSGRLIDRRRAPESLHYILGLNFLVTNQIDLAIEELSKAAETLGDALEIHLLLGSLYREKGQVARAINIHQSLLQRPKLTRLEHARATEPNWTPDGSSIIYTRTGADSHPRHTWSITADGLIDAAL